MRADVRAFVAEHNFPEYIIGFLQSVQDANNNPSMLTVKAYAEDITFFFNHIGGADINRITLESVESFVNLNSPSTGNRRLSCLKGLVKYLRRQQLTALDISFLKSRKQAEKVMRYCTLDEAKAIMKSIEKHPKKHAMMMIFMNCGVRKGEFIALKISDYKSNDGTLLVNGKGNKQRIVPVNTATKATLDKYLATIDTSDPDALLFTNMQGRPYTGDCIYGVLQTICKKAGIEIKNPHAFRHTCATLMLIGGAPIEDIKEMLGHKDIRTTMKYLHLLQENVRQSAERNPLNTIDEGA